MKQNLFDLNTGWLLFILLLLQSVQVMAQQKIDCDKQLDQEPYFVRHKVASTDLALHRDIEILKHCGNFNSIDSAFLKGPMLGALMLQEVNDGKPATYRTIINFFEQFRKTAAYKDFADGLALYRKIGQKKIDPDNWETDKELFVRMGFTVNDLEDFKAFMLQPAHINLTYLQAFSMYMSELEGMRADK